MVRIHPPQSWIADVVMQKRHLARVAFLIALPIDSEVDPLDVRFRSRRAGFRFSSHDLYESSLVHMDYRGPTLNTHQEMRI